MPHAGPGAVPARGLDRRPDPAAGRGAGTRHALRDQAAAGPGDGEHGLQPFDGAALLAGDQGRHHVLATPRNESLWVGRDGWTPEAVHAIQGDQA